jgi:hypothetical protein
MLYFTYFLEMVREAKALEGVYLPLMKKFGIYLHYELVINHTVLLLLSI